MIIKNENDIKVPDFLNEEFFTNTIEQGLRLDNVKIQEVNFEWGSNPGENYCSAIYRVKVQYDRKESNGNTSSNKYSLIVKTIPITDHNRFLVDLEVFLKEKVAYLDVLPRLEILSKNDVFGAKYLYSIKSPIQTIVFEDLKEKGYVMADRVNCLDWDHSVMVLRKLAKFHATSMVLAQKDPEIPKRFTKGMLSPECLYNSPSYENMFGGVLEHLVAATATWPGYEKISKHLQRNRDNFLKITSSLGAPKSNDRFQVLNHGDMWTNNFMFAYDDPKNPNKPTRAVFVDFQMSFYGSPGCDINFFLSTSVKLPLLKERRDELIKEYYTTLKETLEYLRYENIPTFEDLKFELRSRELYGLFALYGFLPVVTMPKEISADNNIDKFNDKDFHKKQFEKVFALPHIREYMEYGLTRLDEAGVFQDY